MNARCVIGQSFEIQYLLDLLFTARDPFPNVILRRLMEGSVEKSNEGTRRDLTEPEYDGRP
jgi:hypothetical protein